MGPTTIKIIDAPKLTVLGYASTERSHLLIGAITIQVQQSSPSQYWHFDIILDVCSPLLEKMIPTSLTTSLQTVKVLAINSIGPNLYAVVGFLRCIPYTEKLYIEVNILLLNVKIPAKMQSNMELNLFLAWITGTMFGRNTATTEFYYFGKFSPSLQWQILFKLPMFGYVWLKGIS